MEIEVRERVALRRERRETRTGRRSLRQYTLLVRKKDETVDEFRARIRNRYPQAEIIIETKYGKF